MKILKNFVKREGNGGQSETQIKMKLQNFPAVITLQRIGKLLQFDDRTQARLKRRCYSQPDTATRMLEQFKKYLVEMDRRTTQKIPKEQLVEYFGGTHKNDIVIKGKVNQC